MLLGGRGAQGTPHWVLIPPPSTQTSVPPKAAFIPVLNIPRADFALRTETTFLLREHSIPDSSLIFRDEIDLAGLHRAGLLSLTLVDHHVLPR